MPGKTGHRKRKYLPLGKKKNSGRVFPATAVHQLPVSSPEVPASVKDVSTPVASTTPRQYPYIYAELRRTGILSGVILAILVALALVLS